MKTIREMTLYKNKRGKIVKFENLRFGGVSYVLFDASGNFVKELFVPFRVADYL